MTAASALLAGQLGAALGHPVSDRFGQSTVDVPVSVWQAAAWYARDELGCAGFDWLGAQDAGRPGSVAAAHEVYLHVLDPVRHLGLLIRTAADAGTAVPSLAAVWAGAAWHEREAAEMFGLEFTGHPDPRRLLLPDEFAGHPLRKDFVLASRVVAGWPGRFEPGAGEAEPSGRRRHVPPGLPDPSWGPRPAAPHRNPS